MPCLSRLALLLGSLALPLAALAPLTFASPALAKSDRAGGGGKGGDSEGNTDGGTGGSTDGGTGGSTDGGTGGSTDGGTGGGSDGSTGGSTDGGTDGGSDGSTGGSTDGGTDGGTGGGTDGGSGGSTGGSTDGGTGGNTDGSTGGSTDGGTDDGTGGGTDGGSGGSTGGNTEGGTDGGTGGGTDGSTEGGTASAPPPITPAVLGSSGTATFVAARPSPDRLAPYAEALLRLNRARAALATAQAELSRLQSMGPAARARAFPQDGPGIDRAAWQADLDRLAPFVEDHARLAGLSQADKAQLFPGKNGPDEAAYQATLRRYARNAADHAALAALPLDRLRVLYPRRAGAKDHRHALAAARTHLREAQATSAAAEAEAARLNAHLIGPRPLTPAEADYLAAYLGG